MGNDVKLGRPRTPERGSVDPARQRRLAVLHELALRQMEANAQTAPRPSRQARPVRPSKRPRARSRMRRVVAVISALVIIVVSLAAIPAIRENGMRLFGMKGGSSGGHSASPLIVYLLPDIPWATVEVDGKQTQASVPSQMSAVALAPGQHHVTWQAEPFQLHTCTLTVPAAHSDTCAVASKMPLDLPGTLPAQVLTLPESLRDLSQNSTDDLLRAINHALPASTATLHPGERFYNTHASPYADGSGPVFTAKQELQVRLGMVPTYGSAGYGFGTCQFTFGGTEPVPCKINGEDCYAICAVPWETRLADGPAWGNTWDVFIAVHLFRDFIAPSGQVVISDNALDANHVGIFAHLVRLRITWSNAQWHVTPMMGAGGQTPAQTSSGRVMYDPGCMDAEDIIAQSHLAFSTIQFISGPIPADGCLVVPNPGPGTELGRYLVRFGVPIALQPGQQLAGTNLPLADAYERQIAQQLARYSGQTFSAAAG